MILKLFDGPMDGAVYALSRETSDRINRSTNRKPDGLWFDAIDEQGRNVQHQYAGGNAMPLVECKEPVALEYRYTGVVVDTGIEMETAVEPEKIEPWCNTIMEQPLGLHEQQDLFNQMNKWLRANQGGNETKLLHRQEIENIYRMQATIVALHNEIAAGDTAIRQLEVGITNPRGDVTSGNRPTLPDEIPDCFHAAQSLECANCAEVSTNPGQFLPDGRWVCTEVCRKELCQKLSYDDLAASGGIVDAP